MPALTAPLVVYVDVDDTLVRSFGAKRIPMSSMVEHVRELHRRGVTLYCWSTGGAAYAQSAAEELGLTGCFVGFLPKPHVMLDDQRPAEWRSLICVHPNEAVSKTVEDYLRLTGRSGG
jgi:hypothetical protein